MNMKKRAEAYIDTVITIFLGLVVLYLGINIFMFSVTYTKMNDMANVVAEWCAERGETVEADVRSEFASFAEGYGFDMEDISVSFTGTDRESYLSSEKVQYGETLAVTLSSEKSFNMIGMDQVSVPITITKVNSSQRYWKESGVNINRNPNRGTTPSNGDIYIDNPYTYTFDGTLNGWVVSSDNSMTGVAPLLMESIDGYPILIIDGLYSEQNITGVYDIPESVISMKKTFYYCSQLTKAPDIPSRVTTLEYCFCGCSKLTSTPDFSRATSLKNMGHAFESCTKLRKITPLPDSVEILDYAFSDCGTDLSQGVYLDPVPAIPASATSISHMFAAKDQSTVRPGKLKVFPDLSKATNLKDTSYAFWHCEVVNGSIVIPESVEKADRMFAFCYSMERAPIIPASVKDVSIMFYFCKELRGTVQFNGTPTSYSRVFGETTNSSYKPARDYAHTIVVTGACSTSVKNSIASTLGSFGTVS